MNSTLDWSIRLKLAIFVGVLVLVTSTVLIWTSYVLARDILVDQINERLTVVAQDRRALLQTYINQQQERVRLVASRTRLRQLLEAHTDGAIDTETFQIESSGILADAQASTGDFLSILIVDLDGQVVTATSNAFWAYDFAAEPAFIEGQSGPFLGLPELAEDHYWTFLSGPAVSNSGRLLGVVIVELDLSAMKALVDQNTALGQSGELLLATANGDQVRYLFPPQNAPDTTLVPLASVPAMSQALAGDSGFIETVDYRNEPVLAAFQPVGYQDWGTVAKIDIAEAYIPIDQLRTIMLLVGLGVLLVGLLATSEIARRVARPIARLAEATAAFGGGDYGARVGLPAGDDELSQLANTFDQMAGAVQNAYTSLEERVRARTIELSRANKALEAEIAERSRAEAALAEKAEALRRSNVELEQYAYVASHDLQEPLRMVKSYVEFLAADYEGQLDDKADRYIGYAVDGASRMQILIDDLLAFSRIGKQSRPFQLVDCEELISEVVSNMSATLAACQGTVHWDQLPTLTGDRTQLGQLFQNLINNGIKYRGEAIPAVTITAEPLNGDSGWRFAVQDNGIGIAPRHHERIFRMFERLHHRNEFAGTGIGLAICHKIVDRHGGDIWVESTEGEGSTFFFTVQTNNEEEMIMTNGENSKSADQLHVLLVDDNPGDIELTQRILQDSDLALTFSVAEDGEAAMAMLGGAGEHGGPVRPDLILLDLKMPRMDGYQVLDALLADSELKDIPVMVLTSTSAETDMLYSKGIHPSSFCRKPLELERFEHFVGQIGSAHAGALAGMEEHEAAVAAELAAEPEPSRRWWWPFGKG